MTKPRLSVSSWSLHKTLGSPAFYGVESLPSAQPNRAELSLLELPQAIANFGISTLEITHFHLPSLDKAYLSELRASMKAANIDLFSLLIDDGDITHPSHGKRDLAWIESWLEVAAGLGSTCVRVIAGKQDPTPEVLTLSAKRLEVLAEKAEGLGLRLMTENWLSTTSTPEAVLYLMDSLGGKVGLCMDFGNWKGEEKYQNLGRIAHHAESCHSKAFFEKGKIDEDDFRACLEIAEQAGFAGPHTLIFDSEQPDEWQGLAIEKDVVLPYCS